MAVSKRLRYEVLRRDNHTCRYCGSSAPDVKLTVDHVTPTALGGSDNPGNLVAACADCNSGKSATSPDAALVADVSDRDLQWVRAIALASESILKERDDKAELMAQFEGCWEGMTNSAWLADDWQRSIETFMKAGLSNWDLGEAINITSRAKVSRYDLWRYFCGVCWRMLDDLRARAEQLLAEGKV